MYIVHKQVYISYIVLILFCYNIDIYIFVPYASNVKYHDLQLQNVVIWMTPAIFLLWLEGNIVLVGLALFYICYTVPWASNSIKPVGTSIMA